jgi:hypothetical protein
VQSLDILFESDVDFLDILLKTYVCSPWISCSKGYVHSLDILLESNVESLEILLQRNVCNP